MGILNVTPDSFSDGGRYGSTEAAVERGLAMIEEGASIIDVGGESTRPGAISLDPKEEQRRVLPVIDGLARAGAVVSVDTYHAQTARAAVEAGAELVNDVSGGLWDEGMLDVCAELGCGVVLMHTRGRPGEWEGLPAMEDVSGTVERELGERVRVALNAGIQPEALMVDPGFGFGKAVGENYRLMAEMGRLQGLGFPVLAGVSRKGFLAGALKARGGAAPGVEERLHATVAGNTVAVLGGAHVLRVHDVRPAVDGAAVADAILASENAEALAT